MVYFFNFKESGITQGGIGTQGDTSNTARVRTIGRFKVDPMVSKRVTVSAIATTGKALQYDIYGYTNATTNTISFDYYWYSVDTPDDPHNLSIRSDPQASYIRCVLRYADNTTIMPSEIESWTMKIEDIWDAEENQYPQNIFNPELYNIGLWIKPYPVMAYRAAQGEVPHFAPTILQSTPQSFYIPYPYGYWRIDESNNGYPYTDLLKGIPRAIPTPPPPPPPPDVPSLPLVQPDSTTEITDQTSLEYRRYMNGYTNPNLYRFRDGELPENTECDVFIKGTHSHRYTSINDYEDFSTECEIP